MKKEIIACLILMLLFSCTLINAGYLNRMIAELTDFVDASRSYADDEKWEEAETELRRAMETWDTKRGYTHIFVRHTEIDCTTDAFYDMLGAVLASDHAGVVSAQQKLRTHLTSISEMEQLSPGSIF